MRRHAHAITTAIALMCSACTTVIVGTPPADDEVPGDTDTTAADSFPPIDTTGPQDSQGPDHGASDTTGEGEAGTTGDDSTGPVGSDASTGDNEAGASTGEPAPLPTGADCSEPGECESGRCMFAVCVDACDLGSPDCDNVAACLPAAPGVAGCVYTGIDTIDAGTFAPNESPAGFADTTGDRDAWITELPAAGLYAVIVKSTDMVAAVYLSDGSNVAGPGEALDRDGTMWRYAFNTPAADTRVWIVLTAGDISEPSDYYLYVTKL